MLQLQTTRPPKTFNHHPNIGSSISASNPRQAQSFRVERAGTHYGRALLKQDKLPEAIRIFRGRQGRLAEVAEAFSRVLRLHPEDAGAHNNLGNVLALQGKHEEDVRQFEETVRLK